MEEFRGSFTREIRPKTATSFATADAAIIREMRSRGAILLGQTMPVGDALPLGLQMTADLGQDARLLQAALLVHRKCIAGPKIQLA